MSTVLQTQIIHMCYSVNLVQTSASKGLLRMFRRPAHGPRVDVIQLAASAWAPIIITPSIFKQVLLAISHYSRDGSVVSDRDERQPSHNGGGRHDVDDRLWFGLIQLLRPALTSLHPPRGGIPVRRSITTHLRNHTEQIYNQILQQEQIELHKLGQLIKTHSGIILDYNTDAINYTFLGNKFPFELMKDIQLNMHYWDKSIKFINI
jgi:hypothetical protein